MMGDEGEVALAWVCEETGVSEKMSVKRERENARLVEVIWATQLERRARRKDLRVLKLAKLDPAMLWSTLLTRCSCGQSGISFHASCFHPKPAHQAIASFNRPASNHISAISFLSLPATFFLDL